MKNYLRNAAVTGLAAATLVMPALGADKTKQPAYLEQFRKAGYSVNVGQETGRRLVRLQKNYIRAEVSCGSTKKHSMREIWLLDYRQKTPSGIQYGIIKQDGSVSYNWVISKGSGTAEEKTASGKWQKKQHLDKLPDGIPLWLPESDIKK